jgi:NADH-quinone oxidoreductase subunit E/NADP-reducing hydrogenase subunit HndA
MLPSEHYRHPEPGAVLAALHEITARSGYLPEDELRQAAAELGVPLSLMFSVASFYAAFTFRPCGRHKVHVCEGTACYVKGSPELLARLRANLGLAPDETTADLAFTLKRVRCVGSCGLAPVVRVDGDTYGHLTPSALDEILAKYRS